LPGLGLWKEVGCYGRYTGSFFGRKPYNEERLDVTPAYSFE